MDDAGPLCLACADLDHLVFLPAGDAALTRRAARASSLLDGLIQPGWALIARSSDAVHMTLRAVTATQGFSFRTRHGVSAPAYWDVESTFWLRWRFESADLVEITKLPAASQAYSGSC